MPLHISQSEIAPCFNVCRFSIVLDFKKVREIRLKLGLSQEEAARAAGLGGRQRWYEIESGKETNLTISTLNGVAKALGVKAKDLLK